MPWPSSAPRTACATCRSASGPSVRCVASCAVRAWRLNPCIIVCLSLVFRLSFISHTAARVQPMVATIQFLARNYKDLKRQTRELQGEIAPAVKQVPITTHTYAISSFFPSSSFSLSRTQNLIGSSYVVQTRFVAIVGGGGQAVQGDGLQVPQGGLLSALCDVVNVSRFRLFVLFPSVYLLLCLLRVPGLLCLVAPWLVSDGTLNI